MIRFVENVDNIDKLYNSAEKLATRIKKFMYDYDTYDFMDNVDNEEDAFEEIISYLLNGEMYDIFQQFIQNNEITREDGAIGIDALNLSMDILRFEKKYNL